jgi:hypothetical protein
MYITYRHRFTCRIYLISLFAVYLRRCQQLRLHIWQRMTGLLMLSELENIWKKELVAYLKRYSGIFLWA